LWREEVGIEKPPIRVEACGVHQDHISSRKEKYNIFLFEFWNPKLVSGEYWF
jgi:hypothetical protein